MKQRCFLLSGISGLGLANTYMLNVPKLFNGIASGIYAVITLVEALGLWYEKCWARILVLVLVGISMPAEIFELIKGITVLKLVSIFRECSCIVVLTTPFS